MRIPSINLNKIKKPFQFLIVRHSQSIWNKDNKFTGWTDIPLSEQGKIEAVQLGNIINKNKIKPYCIFTSDLTRAYDTSKIIKDTFNSNLEIYSSWRLNEKSYGDCEGVNRDLLISQTSKDYVSELRRSFFMLPPKLEHDIKFDFNEFKLKTCKHYFDNKLYNGETKEMLLHRLLPFWYESIIPRIKDHTCPLIVTHKHTARVLIKYLTQMSLTDFDKLDFPNNKIHHIKLNNDFFVEDLKDINILT